MYDGIYDFGKVYCVVGGGNIGSKVDTQNISFVLLVSTSSSIVFRNGYAVQSTISRKAFN